MIIGAGQTGRGFIAPFLVNNGHQVVFIDKDKDLIAELCEKEQYTIRYFGNNNPPATIKNYKAYDTQCEEAVSAIAQADYIFTAVGESQVKNLIELLQESLKARTTTGERSRLVVITCENGINPRKALLEAGLDQEMDISAGIVFCTTISKDKTSLNLLSENFDHIPYDAEPLESSLEIDGFKPISSFSDLIERKIYTYNCYSACISYIGDYKGYRQYGEAANDHDIESLLNMLSTPINQSIAREYNVVITEQEDFAKVAVQKFQNVEIEDTISRNARDVRRKLGPSERLIRPLNLMKAYNQSTEVIELMIAAALYFGWENKEWTETIEEVLISIAKIDSQAIRNSIMDKYSWFQNGISVETMIVNLMKS